MQQNLYSPNRIGKPKTKTGFANATSARMTLKNIAPYDLTYQKQVVITMYNRALYHPNRTPQMKEAMAVYATWMNKNKIKYSRSKRKTRKINEK
jgi:hypothetical protein